MAGRTSASEPVASSSWLRSSRECYVGDGRLRSHRPIHAQAARGWPLYSMESMLTARLSEFDVIPDETKMHFQHRLEKRGAGVVDTYFAPKGQSLRGSTRS